MYTLHMFTEFSVQTLAFVKLDQTRAYFRGTLSYLDFPAPFTLHTAPMPSILNERSKQ